MKLAELREACTYSMRKKNSCDCNSCLAGSWSIYGIPILNKFLFHLVWLVNIARQNIMPNKTELDIPNAILLRNLIYKS